jgi:hypothetical protein
MAVKDNTNVAEIMSGLISDIFDLTQAVYKCISKGYAADSHDSSDSQAFNDALNYSAMMVDYGLAEIFAAVLLLTCTLQSASVKLTSTGNLILSGSAIKQNMISEVRVNTPTAAGVEGFYVAEGILALVEVGLYVASAGLDFAAIAKKANNPSTKEAL